MNETNDYKPSKPHPTPPPKFVPASPNLSTSYDEPDDELDALQTLNDSLSAQVISLSAMLAERGMVELWTQWWAYLEPYREEAAHQAEQKKTAALAHENELSYLAIQLLQERRAKPRKEYPETILTSLQRRAKTIQNRFTTTT